VITLIAALSLWLGRVTPNPGEVPDVWFWTRFWIGRNLGFMIFIYVGVALHMLYRGFWSRRTFAVVAACIIGLFYLTTHYGPFGPPYLPDDQSAGYFNSFVTGFGVFMVFYLIGNRLPKSQPVQTLGNISYEVYLTVTVIGWTILAWLTNSIGYFWALPLASVAVLAIAYTLYRLVEKPTYDLAQNITAHPRFKTQTSWSDPPRGRRRLRRQRAEPGIADPVREPINPPDPDDIDRGTDSRSPGLEPA
jgi:peptidoglycan/LPS O-acetylase OafA/YrhL